MFEIGKVYRFKNPSYIRKFANVSECNSRIASFLGDSCFRVLDVDDWYGVTALQSLAGEQEIIAQNEGDFLQCYTLLAKSEFEYFVEVLEEVPKSKHEEKYLLVVDGVPIMETTSREEVEKEAKRYKLDRTQSVVEIYSLIGVADISVNIV